MITLTASNVQLTQNAKYSYLNDNYLSGVTSFVLSNCNGFAANDYLLLGEFGTETAEIVQIDSVTASTHTIALKVATKFAHAESTKVTIIKYNQVRFYHTTTATFAADVAVTGFIDIQADDLYTKAYDTTYTTGFGWFIFYNSTLLQGTTNSNAIPYAGFGENSVRNILDNFFSQLNSKESKLISYTDAFRWLNEAYARAKNELNLVNNNYTVDGIQSISVTTTTQEYDLESDFSSILSVWNETSSYEMEPIDMKDVSSNDSNSNNVVRFYLRAGKYIGFSPLPSSAFTAKVRYKTKTETLTSLYDNVELPNNNHYILLDYLLYRAAPKMNRPNGAEYLTVFETNVKKMKLDSMQNKRGESWGIAPEANI